jgi:ribosomal protein S18 acetylase RimI-like enzyme
MRIEKISPIEKAQELLDMDIKTFTRDFDLPARNVDDITSYLIDSEVYLVYEDNDVIGNFSYEEKGGQIEIKEVLVLPQYQGKGYGKKIMDYLLNLVKGKPVWLVTHPKNTPAIITYLKSGFILTEWKDNYYGDGHPRLLFRLK